MRTSLPQRLRRFVRRLHRHQSGVALIEFALSVPIFVGLGMYGTEIAYMAVVNMQMSQAALNLADNASRLGQTDSSVVAVTIKESDVLNVFSGTKLQTDRYKLFTNGRVILSSLEQTPAGGQWIHWQRCKGLQRFDSAYGKEGTGLVTPPGQTPFAGMGPKGQELTASPGTAVIFVELYYKYPGLFGNLFVKDRMFYQQAAHNIRDDRNLSVGLSNDVSTSQATCDKYTAS